MSAVLSITHAIYVWFPLYTLFMTGTIDFSINTLFTENRIPSERTPTLLIKVIDRFGDKNRVNSGNFNAMIFILPEKFDHPFSQVFIFGNMFLQSHGFVAMRITSCIKGTCSNVSQSN